MYGIPNPGDEHDREVTGDDDDDDDDDEDIEASIQKELNAMKAPKEKPATQQTFTPVSSGVECVFFVKTIKPVEPDRLVRKICEDAQACPDPRQRKCRYINRLTPVLLTDRATENGIERVARSVLKPFFELKPEDGADPSENDADADASKVGDKDAPFTVSAECCLLCFDFTE